MTDRQPAGLNDPADFDTAWYLDHVVLPQAAGETGAQTAWRILADRLRSTRVGARAAQQGFVLTRAQALAMGVTRAELRRLIHRGAWHVPGYGCVAPFEFPGAAAVPALRATSAALTRTRSVVSHRSAAVLHDLPLIDVPGWPLTTTELTAVRSDQRRQPSAHVRTAPLPPAHVTSWYGAPVTTVARTVFDLARRDRGQGLVCADAAAHRSLLDADEVAAVVGALTGQSGVVQAREVLAMADRSSESPLESLTRLVLHDRRVPPPELQVWITDPRDGWRARVDMCWPRQRLVLEADGRTKYTGDELWREKVRQDRLEQLDYRVMRVRWHDVVAAPDLLAARVMRNLGR